MSFYNEEVNTRVRSIVVLEQVFSLIESPECWSANQLAEAVGGKPVAPSDPLAIRWSITGALTRCNTTILAINALISVSGCDLTTIQLRMTHRELLHTIRCAIEWLEKWREY